MAEPVFPIELVMLAAIARPPWAAESFRMLPAVDALLPLPWRERVTNGMATWYAAPKAPDARETAELDGSDGSAAGFWVTLRRRGGGHMKALRAYPGGERFLSPLPWLVAPLEAPSKLHR